MRERSPFALLLPGIVAFGGCAAPVPPRLAWTAASEVQTISPSGATTLQAGDGDVAVEAGGSLWIQALPGERVRVTGAARSEDLDVGIAARDADPAEAITWLAGAAIPGGVTWLVPHWSPSSTVVVRARAAARLRVAVAEPEVDPLGWERFEEDAVEWARGARATPPPLLRRRWRLRCGSCRRCATRWGRAPARRRAARGCRSRSCRRGCCGGRSRRSCSRGRPSL